MYINFFLDCPEGSFGPDCRGVCECGRNYVCDHVTGSCSCKAGFKGKKCQKGKS